MCRDAVEPAHPLFEAVVVGIHVLHVIDLAGNPSACSQTDWTVGDTNFPKSGTQCLAAARKNQLL